MERRERETERKLEGGERERERDGRKNEKGGYREQCNNNTISPILKGSSPGLPTHMTSSKPPARQRNQHVLRVDTKSAEKSSILILRINPHFPYLCGT